MFERGAMMTTLTRRSFLVVLASAALLLMNDVASARYLLNYHSSDNRDGMWVSLGAVSCMDDNNLDMHRYVGSMMDCKMRCAQSKGCMAVTYNSDGMDCYLKEKCSDKEERDDGYMSAIMASAAGDDGDDDTDDDDDNKDWSSEEEEEKEWSSESGGDHISDMWEPLGDVTCMDYGGMDGPAWMTHRDVDSLKECEKKCGESEHCNAVTYNTESKDCYLKMTCYDQEKLDNGDVSSKLKDVKFCWGMNDNGLKVFGMAHDDNNVCCVASPPGGGSSWECCMEQYGCDGTCYQLMTNDDHQKGEPAC